MSGREKTTRLTSGAANETQALESGGALQGWTRRDFAQPLGYFGATSIGTRPELASGA